MNNKKFSILLFYIFLVHHTFSQTIFQKTIGGAFAESTSFLEQTSDGGYIIVGSTDSYGIDSSDVYLIKTNSLGDTVWTRTFGGANQDYGYSVRQTFDGGYIITGRTNGVGSGTDYILLLRTDGIGNLIWTRCFGSGIFYELGWDVQQTADSGFVIVGVQLIYPYALYGRSIIIIRTNETGDTLWTKKYSGTGSGSIEGKSITQASDGGFVLVGNIIQSFPDYDMLILRTDSSGNAINNILSSHCTGTFFDWSADYATQIKKTYDGGYIVVGSTGTCSQSSYDFVYLKKLNSNANVVWSKLFSGIPPTTYGTSVSQTSDRGFIITGATNNDVYLIKADSNANVQWAKTYGSINSDNGVSVYQTVDGGFIIGGNTESYGAGNSDIYLIKTDSLGNSGCNDSAYVSITTSDSNNNYSFNYIVGAGFLTNTPNIQPGAGGIITTQCSLQIFEKLFSTSSLFILPNPTTGKTYITMPDDFVKEQNLLLSIYDNTGKLIQQQTLEMNDGKIKINLEQEAKGIYNVMLSNKKKSYSGKIVFE